MPSSPWARVTDPASLLPHVPWSRTRPVDVSTWAATRMACLTLRRFEDLPSSGVRVSGPHGRCRQYEEPEARGLWAEPPVRLPISCADCLFGCITGRPIWEDTINNDNRRAQLLPLRLSGFVNATELDGVQPGWMSRHATPVLLPIAAL